VASTLNPSRGDVVRVLLDSVVGSGQAGERPALVISPDLINEHSPFEVMPMVNLTVNGRSITVPDNTALLHAVRAAGAELPTLCYWDGLPPYGACRLCLVEVRRDVTGTSESAGHVSGRIVASCAYPVEDGLAVETDAAGAVALRRLALEFLLSRCPQSDVIRDLAVKEGVEGSRFPANDKRDELCVLCGLCVRVCRDLVGAAAIGFIGRGTNREVGAPFRLQAEACIGCGACAAVCPTGAVKIEDVDGRRVLHTWNTIVPLKPCPVCGRPFGPEPMAFLRELAEASEPVWGVCPACRRKAAAASLHE
jgi:formate hydrogenlyase subunit 6/NADH:ubiquinone oxidoreductase subunit I